MIPRLDNDAVVLAEVNHFEAMTHESCVSEVAKLLKNKIRRWTPEEVAKAQKVLFGDEKKR